MIDSFSEQRFESPEAPAMGERRARWGYGYQDKAATARILNILRQELVENETSFQEVRLADVHAGRVDDFVLVWADKVEGNSIKWSGDATSLNWGELLGVNGLLKELADGYIRLSNTWIGKTVRVRLQSNRPASIEKHHSQLVPTFSLAEFLRDHWPKGPKSDDARELTQCWAKIGDHVNLKGPEFLAFVRACEIALAIPEDPPAGPNSLDLQHYRKQFDELHKAIATWITNYPTRTSIDRVFLLRAVGVEPQSYGLIQRFPLPQIPYEQNSTTGQRLRERIDSLQGGYLAISGPAGVGKSTLVQDVLADYPAFIPYYAYLPNGEGNPRDRGEATVFFQDVVLRLDKFLSHRYSVGVADVAQGREALRQHLKRAHELFVSKDFKTILLIDGLDHVMREPGLERSILYELPKPDEVPDGFLIILSSQSQALLPSVIERHVANAISPGSDRRVEVEGLNRSEVHSILQKAISNVGTSDRDAIFEACQGNPLVLTYLLNSLTGDSPSAVSHAIAAAGNYGGDIDEYYGSCLAVPLQNTEIRRLLALLSRAAPIIPVPWLQSWPEQGAVEHLFETVLSAFVRVEDQNLFFIHNSLIAYLKEQTRTRLPGANFEQDEHSYHSALADRCGTPRCAEPLGRAKVFHLLRSQRDQELLNLITSDWLRGALEDFLPYAQVRPIILHGLASAWKLNEYGEVLRLILLDQELAGRTSRMEPDVLAHILLKLDRSRLAISQIRSAGQILVKDKAALEFARSLWHYAKVHGRDELKKLSRTLYVHAKPLEFLYQGEPIDPMRNDSVETLRAWATTAPLFETADRIIADVNRLQFSERRPEEQDLGAFLKADFLYTSLRSAIDIGWSADLCSPFVDELHSLQSPMWVFASMLALYFDSPSAEMLSRLEMENLVGHNLDLDLVYAEILHDAGEREKASAIVSGLKHVRYDYFERRHSMGLTDISYTIKLRCLQHLLGIPEGNVPGVENDREEALARVETAARKLGLLLAKIRSGDTIANPREEFRSILLFHNRSIRLDRYDWHQNYIIGQAKLPLYRYLIDAAGQMGSVGANALRDEFLEVISGPAGSQFTPECRRVFAFRFYELHSLKQSAAVSLGLSSAVDIEDDDPQQRQTACTDIAVFLHQLGDEPASDNWLKRAAVVSAGAGSHKDYHMAQLAEWLSAALPKSLDPPTLEVLDLFFKAIEVAGGAGGPPAAKQLIEELFAIEPLRTSHLAIELIDRDILHVSETLASLLLGGVRAKVSSSLLIAIYRHLLSLIQPGDTSNVAAAILRTAPLSERLTTADVLMSAVRTNSLPARRVAVARVLQDAICEDGQGKIQFTQGLPSGDDDSAMRTSLYKLASGQLLTLGEMAARLSTPDNQSDWNPNPTDNGDFGWWDAIKKTKVRDFSHMEDLMRTFPPPDYRNVELLAWKSRWLMTFGETQAAREMARESLTQSLNASWFDRWDGAQQRIAFSAMRMFDESGTIRMAREKFGRDLVAGKLYTFHLLDEIHEIFQFLELDWPRQAVLEIIADYIKNVLAANRQPESFKSFGSNLFTGSANQSLCYFLMQLLAFPVIEVGMASRKALTQYAVEEGTGIVELMANDVDSNSVQFEHLLACIDLGLRHGSSAFKSLQQQLTALNRHESIAVRAIARRTCAHQNWLWQEITDLPRGTTVITARAELEQTGALAALVVDGAELALETYGFVVDVLEMAGNSRSELVSEFYRLYKSIETEYQWTNKDRLDLWISRVFARFWFRPGAFVGREAAMRLLGGWRSSGRAPDWAEQAYDSLSPVYDPALELLTPAERPNEMKAMDWRLHDDSGAQWLRGEGANTWVKYPTLIGPLHIIGESTLFIRPDWEWPREERHRGLLDHFSDEDNEKLTKDVLASRPELTYAKYAHGDGQDEEQIIIWNSAWHPAGKQYGWMALNSSLARSFGWSLSPHRPFEWLDDAGNLMVKSIYWRDGWTDLEPPRFESLGTGWLVLATQSGLDRIASERSSAQYHLWVERHSHGQKPYHGMWHLISSLTSRRS